MDEHADFNKDFGITEPPTIIIDRAKFDQNAEAGENALVVAQAPIFRRGDLLVRPVYEAVDASDGRQITTVWLKPLTLPLLRQLLNRAANWKKHDGRTRRLIDAAPPAEVAELILHRADLGPFPVIAGVITTPTMRPDGSLLMTPGYDEATRLLLFSDVAPQRVPDNPTREDSECALADLQALVTEFPFVDDPSRSVALSGLITPVVRGVMPAAPMHAASAPRAGSGKSFLWDLAAFIAIGKPCPIIAAGRDEEETEKRLTAVLLRGLSMVSIDNLNGPLEGDFLCQMIERPNIEVRRLGTSDAVTIENRITSYATGNNLRVRGDAVRRVLHCRLDANVEHPERRVFDSQPDELIQRHRSHFVAQCLTIVRAYIVAGRPGCLDPIPSFGAWSDNVRSALVWLGCADPCATIEEGRSDDDNEEATAAMFTAWPRGVGALEGYTTAEIIEEATRGDATGVLLRPDLLDALRRVGRNRRGELDPLTLGQWLRRHRDQVVDGLKLKRKGSQYRPLWTVEPP
jgi:putative DNA primase/helicase